MADNKSREVIGSRTKLGGEGCGNSACYCTGACRGETIPNPFDYSGGDNEVRLSQDGEATDNGITIKVTADMAEAITGFKALQRELRETTKAVREYESAVESVDGNFRIGTHSGEVSIVTTSELKSDDPSIGRDTDFVYRHKPDVVEATTNEGTLTTFDLSEVPTEELRNELAKRQ